MDSEQVASAYAVAKIMGYEKSVDDFEAEYEPIFKEARSSILQKRNKPAPVDAVPNPFRSSGSPRIGR